MTISVFWEVVKPAAQTMSLKELCIQEGFVEKRRNIGTIILGVDACLWITQCMAASHAQVGKNPELKTLFFKLAALNQTGVTAVFVFDGPDQPSTKRGKPARAVARLHWLVPEFVKLVELFGFHYYMAPGRADAELGCLDHLEYIDGILSDDGDVAIFGARRIIREMNKDIPDEITVYTAKALEHDPAVGLTQGGILLFAMLVGGDYDTAGLLGFGAQTAHALARCGFGDSLLVACQTMNKTNLDKFLAGWREEIAAELDTNSRGFLHKKQNKLSTKIPETFPSHRVLSLYVHPITSWSAGFNPPATADWDVKLPSLASLALYCTREFGWKPSTIADKFQRLIFPGLFTRRLTMVFLFILLSMLGELIAFLHIDQPIHIHNHVVNGHIHEEYPLLSTYLSINCASTTETSKKYHVKNNIGGLKKFVLSHLPHVASASGPASQTAYAWIAAPLIQLYFPAMVTAFNSAMDLPLISNTAVTVPVSAGMTLKATPKHLDSTDLIIDDKGEGSWQSGTQIAIDLPEEKVDGDIIELDWD
ncbi:hypothetical protein MSAN_02064600 [Mycena sanguinolenta]|uniref:XPG-I domain-containing protein n=1 Tax=Mycena sanguinolenta TaxID=230812 RepID=A0A8H7CL21_9AGAR|nr:hypothetical protein MSAN_02064600 [Mycena sanguinolenta]